MKKNILFRLNKKIISSFIGMVACLSLTVPVMAAGSNVTTGGVHISIDTSTLKSGKRVSFTDMSGLQPGERVDYFITVTNNALPSYVRVKIIYDANFEIDDSSKILRGISDKWLKKNGYYYYEEPLSKGESVDFCNTFCTPDINKGKNSYVNINVKADCIQAKNFTPKFEEEDPWMGIAVESNVAIGDMYETERAFAISCDDNMKLSKNKVLTVKGNVMPGDSVEDKVVITPSKTGKTTLKAVYNASYPEEAENIKLTIKNGSKSLYEGSLFSDKLKDGISLGSLTKSKDVTLNYKLTFDTKLTNKSSWKEIPVNFVLSMEPDKDDPKNDEVIINEGDIIVNYITEPAGVLGETISKIPEEGVLGAIRNNVLTGDHALPVLWFCLGVLAIIGAFVTAIVMFVKKRRA